MSLATPVRRILHQFSAYWQAREILDEGWSNAIHRIPQQRAILNTKPMETPDTGVAEVHILTYRRDWINAIWAIKSFYCWPDTPFPLHIHDGGLLKGQREQLRHHFPNAIIHEESKATSFVESYLDSKNLSNSITFRRINKLMYKLFDFFILSNCEKIITIDSDVLFFREPLELVGIASSNTGLNVFNRDLQYGYETTQENMNQLAGVEVAPYINSGLSCISRNSIDFELIEHCLSTNSFSIKSWLTEQSLVAITSAKWGIAFLPEQYLVSCDSGFPQNTIAKHYPSWPRPHFYREGLKHIQCSPQWNKIRNGSVV